MAIITTELTALAAAEVGTAAANIEMELIEEVRDNFKQLAIAELAVYADNAAAITGGLSAGDFYRTSTGQLMIVYAP